MGSAADSKAAGGADLGASSDLMAAPRTLPSSNGRFALECREVVKSFAGEPVLKGVSCTFPSGAISALVGPSGTGKTTLLRVITGLVLPDSGDVLCDGQSLLASFRRQVGVLLEGPAALFSSMTVFDNVAFPLRRVEHFDAEEIDQRVRTRLKEVGLLEHSDKMPEMISMGMRVRAGFARATVLRPRLLICDSPDYGMDPVRLTFLGELIREMKDDFLRTVILITHDVPSVFNLSDHVVFLHHGRVVEEGAPEEIRASQNPLTEQFIHAGLAGPLGMEA